MHSILTIANLQIYAHHGVHDEERVLGGRYEVDLAISYDAEKAVATDELRHALDYTAVADAVTAILTGQHCRLLETLAARLSATLMKQFPAILELTLRLRKITVPIAQQPDFVQIEQRTTRPGS